MIPSAWSYMLIRLISYYIEVPGLNPAILFREKPAMYGNDALVFMQVP
jgi:hypothetical protein